MFNKFDINKIIKNFNYDKFYYQYVDNEMGWILASHYIEFYNQIEETENEYVKYSIVFKNGRVDKGKRLEPTSMHVEKNIINKKDEKVIKTERLYRESYNEELIKIYKDIYKFFEKDAFREIKCREFLKMIIDYYNLYFEKGDKIIGRNDDLNNYFTWSQLFDWRNDIEVE